MVTSRRSVFRPTHASPYWIADAESLSTAQSSKKSSSNERWNSQPLGVGAQAPLITGYPIGASSCVGSVAPTGTRTTRGAAKMGLRTETLIPPYVINQTLIQGWIWAFQVKS